MGKIDLHLSIDAELLRRAEAAGLDPSAALEDALSSRLDQGMREQAPAFRPKVEALETSAERWARDNAEAIEEHNDRIAERGLIGADWRRW